jgi:hypothetical protein
MVRDQLLVHVQHFQRAGPALDQMRRGSHEGLRARRGPRAGIGRRVGFYNHWPSSIETDPAASSLRVNAAPANEHLDRC